MATALSEMTKATNAPMVRFTVTGAGVCHKDSRSRPHPRTVTTTRRALLPSSPRLKFPVFSLHRCMFAPSRSHSPRWSKVSPGYGSAPHSKVRRTQRERGRTMPFAPFGIEKPRVRAGMRKGSFLMGQGNQEIWSALLQTIPWMPYFDLPWRNPAYGLVMT